MQGVLVFATEAARNSAITSPQEGQFAYTKDTNSLWYYSGSAWVASGATGDIEGVTAGVGISGGGTSGTVTVTNSMATAITTAGDLIKGTGSGTFDRLGIGSTSQVLTVVSGAPAWATPGGDAAFTLLNSGGTALTGAATITVSGITKNNIFILIAGASSASGGSPIVLRINTDTSSKYTTNGMQIRQTSTYTGSGFGSTVNGYNVALDGATKFSIGECSGSASSTYSGYIQISGAKSTGPKILNGAGGCEPASTGSDAKAAAVGGVYTGSSAVSSISLISDSGNFDAGTLYVYEG
jgi:hypothetical protein